MSNIIVVQKFADFHCPARTSSLNPVFVKLKLNSYSIGLCISQIRHMYVSQLNKALLVSCKKIRRVHRNIPTYLQNVFSSIKKGIHSLMKRAEIAIDQGNVYQMSQTQTETLLGHVSVASQKFLVNHCFHDHCYFHPTVDNRTPCE